MAGGDVLAALRDHAYPAAVFSSDLDIARAERHRRRAQACRAAYAQSAAPSRCARQHGGRAEPSLPRPLFRVFFKGMESRDVVGPRDLDPGVAVLAAAVCGPQGEVLHWVQKPVEGVQGRREPLEAMALVEGLHAALGLGITSVTVVTDNILLHNLMLGIWRSPNKMMTDMINQVMSMQRNFEQCEISHVRRSQVSFVVKLARDSILLQIAKSLAISAIEEKRETCAICMEDVDVTNIHAVEGCAHHFCFSCMKEHVKMKLLHGMLPACPKDGCTTMLSVEGSKIFLSPGLLDIMVQRVRERQIPPSKKIYCPYPKCSALMSLSELIHPMQESCSKYTGADVATLRKCVKCRGSFCISCKVPWHDGMMLPHLEWETRYKLEDSLEEIYKLEEILWQRRGGENWILKGDSNTGYFHGIANGRKRRCTILKLEDENRVITEEVEMRAHINHFYQDLFGQEERVDISLHQDIWKDYGGLTDEERILLEAPFTMEELELAVKQMKTNTAPGPNGFPVLFFKRFWPKIRTVFKEMLDDFFDHNLNLGRLNYGAITLIPKIKDACNIKQFRPICVLDVDYKIILKVLTNRLTKVANKIINENQSAFIPGRFILDGVVILHEVIHELHRTHKPGIVLKLDFEKAYDKVHWSFILEVLKRKNFGDRWIKWIEAVLSGGKVCIDVNGTRGDFFKTFRGVRQGDPLSPLLFNLIGDALDAMLVAARKAGDIKGLLPDLVEGGLTHLQYADDTVLFLENDDISIRNVKWILYCFEMLSGLKINYQKSEIFVFGVEIEEQVRIAEIFNCNIGTLPMKYLGIPVTDGNLRVIDFDVTANRAEKKLGTWQCGQLSSGGKSILINSCLSSIPMYMMGMYHLPDTTHKKLDSIRGRFYWQGVGKKRKYHMTKWEIMCRPKEYGGLGFLDTRVMNICLLVKWIVRLDGGDESLCCRFLRNKYMKRTGFLQSRSDGGSQFWKGLHAVKEHYIKGLEFRVRNGRKIRFWEDVWLDKCPLILRFPKIFDICNQQQASVHDLWSPQGWKFTFRRAFGPLEAAEWELLLYELGDLELVEEEDEMGVLDVRRKEIIQSAEQLMKKNWKGSAECKAIAHRSLSYMQRWTSLLKQDRKLEVETLITRCQDLLKLARGSISVKTGIG
ncbi:hypothetical protein ACP70R_021766 [Stipagrostis hirtigluma subsp. patula]